MIRIRIIYAKQGAFRYTSNLDIHRMWERAFRRACLPLAYSQGFHPQPRLNQASPLPLGVIGKAEIVDAWLDGDDLNLQTACTSVDKALPAGILLHSIDFVPLEAPSPQNQVIAAEYRAELPALPADYSLEKNIQTILEQEQLYQERRGKRYDLRPLIQTLQTLSEDPGTLPGVFMRLASGNQATGRPDEVLIALGLDPFSARIERLRVILQE